MAERSLFLQFSVGCLIGLDEASFVGVMAEERMGERERGRKSATPPPTATVNTPKGNEKTVESMQFDAKWFSIA